MAKKKPRKMSAKRRRHLAAKRAARTRKLRKRRTEGLRRGQYRGVMGGVYDKKSWAHVKWSGKKRKRRRTAKQKAATARMIAGLKRWRRGR